MSRSSESDRASPSPAASDRGEANFVSRLQSIVRHWPSADRLARATGVSPSAFRKWLRGEAEPSRERLVALADAAGVSAGWLANGEGPEPRFEEVTRTRSRTTPAAPNRQDYVWLPRCPEGAGAGPDDSAPPPCTEFIAFRHDWIRGVLGIDPERLQLETALGESMLPGIQDGDLLLLDTTETKARGVGIYVMEIAGERLVKRVQPRLDGSLSLISDNKAYETEHVSPDKADNVRIVGRVLWIVGPTRGSRRSPP